MDTRLLPAVRHFWTLVVLSLLLAGCGGEAATPAVLTPASQTSPPPNLLQNADFSAGTVAWQPSTERPPALTLALDPAGFVVVAVSSDVPQRAGWSQTVPVQAGAAYRISWRAHSEELAGCAGVTLAFYDGWGRLLLETARLPTSGSADWATYAWRSRAPAGATQARVFLGVEGATAGRAAFDEPCLAPDDAPVARALVVDWRETVGELSALLDPGLAQEAGAYGAAGLAAELARMQAGGPANACRAGGVAGRVSGAAEPGAGEQARRLLARLAETPQRLLAQGGDDLGFALLAGRSADGRVAQILVADTGSRSEGYRLGLAGFAAGFRYTVTEIAGEAPPLVVREGESGQLAGGVLSLPWRSPALHLIRIWWP